MNYRVELTPQARQDLARWYDDLLDQARTVEALQWAERALAALDTALRIQLARSPFIYRPVPGSSGLRRELVIPVGAKGYVALYEIAAPGHVLVLAVRHQLEEDYH